MAKHYLRITSLPKLKKIREFGIKGMIPDNIDDSHHLHFSRSCSTHAKVQKDSGVTEVSLA
jgi:hypothetical protein